MSADGTFAGAAGEMPPRITVPSPAPTIGDEPPVTDPLPFERPVSEAKLGPTGRPIFGDVGTVDAPGQYVRGRLPMRWGPLPLGPSPLVYFGGRTERTIVGLGGASGHVLGAPVPTQGAAPAEQELPFAPSTAPGLLAGLTAAVTADGADGAPRPDALASVQLANRTLRGAEQEVEFLAKRLLHGPIPYPELDGHDGVTVLLGSPLFVALAD